MNRKNYSFFLSVRRPFFAFRFPRRHFLQQAYGGPQEKQRRKYDRPKHSTPTRRSGNTCRSIIPEPHPTVVRIRHTPGRNDMIRAGIHLLVSSARKYRIRYGETARFAPGKPARTGEDWPHLPECFPYGVPVRSGYGTVYRNTSPEIPRRRNHPPSRRHRQQPPPAYPFLSAARTNNSGGAVNLLNSETSHQTAGRYCLVDCWI